MGPYRRPALLGVGVLLVSVLLLKPTSGYLHEECLKSQFWDEEYSLCTECKKCLKTSSLYVTIMPECQKKNPGPILVGELEAYLWCNIESPRVMSKARELIPTTTPITVQGTTTPKTGMTTNTLLGVTIPIVVLVIALCVICLLCKCIGRMSSSSASSSPSSSEASTPLTKRSGISDIDSGSDEERNSKLCPLLSEHLCPTTTPRPIPPPIPIPIEAEIIADPGCVVNEGERLSLDLLHVWTQSVIWFHDVTSTVHFGPKIVFESISYLQRGIYLAYNSTSTTSISISVIRRTRPTRPGEENIDEPQRAVCVREPVEIGPEAVEMAVTIGLPGIEIEHAPQREAITYQPTDALVTYQPTDAVITSQPTDAIVQPQTVAGAARLVPSGGMNGAIAPGEIHRVANVVDRLLIEIDHGEPPPVGCTLKLADVLQDEIAMQQLSVMVDTSSTLRIFATTKGRMNHEQFEHVKYCTKGSGNTVKGLFKFIFEKKNRAHLTAADFSTSMRDAKWRGCDKIIHLLFSLHPSCEVCRKLHNEYGPTQREYDVRRQPQIPGFEYHLKNKHAQCSQTLRDLARLQQYSEEFRQESTIPFCNGEELPVWRAVGSHLGGMSTELLDYLDYHYRGNDSYLKMLDFLVQLYPQLMVSTFAEWLRDHDYHIQKDIVLKYHKDCPYCRQFAEKH